MGGRPGGPAEPATAPMLALQPGMDRLSHELSAQRDRQVRLQSVQTDLALDLPPSIPLPDGEEIPYGSATRLQIRDPEQESEIYQKCIRPPPNRTVFDGESPPPPYRSSSAGVLASDWSTGSSSSCTGSLVVRCHSMSGTTSSKRPADILGRTVRCLSGKRCHHPATEETGSISSLVPSQSTTRSSGRESSTVSAKSATTVSVIVPSHRCRRLSAFTDAASGCSNSSTLATLPTVQCATPTPDSYHPTQQRQNNKLKSTNKCRGTVSPQDERLTNQLYESKRTQNRNEIDTSDNETRDDSDTSRSSTVITSDILSDGNGSSGPHSCETRTNDNKNNKKSV